MKPLGHRVCSCHNRRLIPAYGSAYSSIVVEVENFILRVAILHDDVISVQLRSYINAIKAM